MKTQGNDQECVRKVTKKYPEGTEKDCESSERKKPKKVLEKKALGKYWKSTRTILEKYWESTGKVL